MSLLSSVPVLRVADYPAARAFWRDVLGFSVVEEAGEPVTGFGIYKRDQAQVFLIAWDGAEAAYPRWRAYFHTDDLDEIATRLDGQDVTGPRLTEYRMRELEVADPSGNVICFGEDVDRVA